MSWIAGSKDKAESTAGQAPETTEGAKGGKAKRSVIFILAGLVVTGAVAVYRWVNSLPKD